jgi:predicted AAA+ superfamily ATPase
MATSNREHVDRALHMLVDALGPFVEREMDARAGASWRKWLDQELERKLERRQDGSIIWEIQPLLKTTVIKWHDVFKKTLGSAERSLIGELLDVRNEWAHQRAFSYEDTQRALDSAERLLQAISAGKAAQEVNAMRQEVLRTMFAEQRRTVERRTTLLLDTAAKAGLKPWREVITPHPDVATGRSAVAEFAADLAQVRRGDAGPEYGDAPEFFRRTFLTAGLSRLLVGAMQRLAGSGGDPVIELQTNFGGGKTHSMLALYHMAGHGKPEELAGVDQLMAEAGVSAVPKAKRAVFVGISFSPGEVVRHEDGVQLRTIWGHLARELGGRDSYALVADSDRQGLAPGSDLLVTLLRRHVPCLILIDEWVAFLRQLYGKSDTPAGSFASNLTFAHSLSEAVKAVPGALLVVSLPASQVEIGGDGGQEALSVLKNTFGPVETSWRPATAQEGFEIVRRRLFQPMTTREAFAARDAVVKAFSDSYCEGGAQFPSECGESDYRKLLETAYPIHPEFFARLNDDWGGLDKFQRTRGVLRLMASVINALWEGDKSLMIMPCSLPLDEPSVLSKLLDYLPRPWDSIISADIDDEDARAYRIDKDNANLQRYGATRRVARTIFLATAPHAGAPNTGIDERRIRLGTVQPGESLGTFSHALRRLVDEATYLYADGSRYWFDTKASLTPLAEQRAWEFDIADVWARLIERLGKARQERGPFTAVQVAPRDSSEVPDEIGVRLVLLGPVHPHSETGESKAKAAALAILDHRGGTPRTYSNTLLFLAPDRGRLDELEEAIRSWMAWTSIVERRLALQLAPFQEDQANAKIEELDRAVEACIEETWIWTMAPHQPDPTRPRIEWAVERVSGNEPLAVRAGKKFVADGALYEQLGARDLRQAMDTFDLWRGSKHVPLKQVSADFVSYLYLPRLRDRQLLADAVRAGIGQLACDQLGCDQLAYAEAYDAAAERYVGLHSTSAGMAPILFDEAAVIVKPEVADAQLARERNTPAPVQQDDGDLRPTPKPMPGVPRRFHGSVEFRPDRLVCEAGTVSAEVLDLLARLNGAQVTMRLEIDIDIPGGIDDEVRRTVEENCRTLRFRSAGFEAK